MSKTVRTYEDVVSFLLQAHAADGVIAEGHDDVVNFHQSSPTTVETCFQMLMDIALRGETVFPTDS